MKTHACLSLLCAALTSLSLGAAEAPLQLTTDLAHPNYPVNRKVTTYLKVGFTGQDLQPDAKRAPVNVALVIDKSGSMSGNKIQHAREAAKEALDRLGPEDTVSIVTYDNGVQVVVPASPLTDREQVKKAIDKITAGGATALFAGVSKGAEELRKHKNPNHVNRIVLLSDGMANVGPETPQELGRLGASLAKEGITVSTLGLGLGYNEDLMTELALRSDGNHAFVENTSELAGVFQNEFGDILSVVAQNLNIRIRCEPGVRPVRVLGRDADVRQQEVSVSMNQIYARQHKYVMVEVELPEDTTEADVPVAQVTLEFSNALSKEREKILAKSVARRVQDPALVSNSVNKQVLVEVAKFIADEREQIAFKLVDEGKLAEAEAAYSATSAWTAQQSIDLGAPELQKISEDQMKRQEWIKEGGARANAARKSFKDDSFKMNSNNMTNKK